MRILFHVLLLMLLTFQSVDAKIVDRIVAIVGTTAITLTEFNDFHQRMKNAPPELLGPDRSLLQNRENILELLIEEKIFENETEKLGLIATDDEVEAEIATIRNRLNASPDQLKAMLRDRGTKYSDYVKFLKKQLEQRRLISQVIRSNVSISDEDIINYYHQHIEKSEVGGEYRASHILLKIPEGKELETRQLAEKLARRVREGGSFSVIAKQNSDGPQASTGGDLGWSSLNEMNPEFKQTLSTLRTGDVSDPFKTPYGIHLLQLVDVRQQPPPQLDQPLKERIRNILFQERISILLKQWMEQKKRPGDGYYIKKML